MEHYKERDRKSTFAVVQIPTLLVIDEILKDPTDVAKAFNNFFILVIKKSNTQQIEKGDALSILKDSFTGILHSIKIIPIIEAEIKSTIHSPKLKKLSSYDEITSKILKKNLLFSHSPIKLHL